MLERAMHDRQRLGVQRSRFDERRNLGQSIAGTGELGHQKLGHLDLTLTASRALARVAELLHGIERPLGIVHRQKHACERLERIASFGCEGQNASVDRGRRLGIREDGFFGLRPGHERRDAFELGSAIDLVGEEKSPIFHPLSRSEPREEGREAAGDRLVAGGRRLGQDLLELKCRLVAGSRVRPEHLRASENELPARDAAGQQAIRQRDPRLYPGALLRQWLEFQEAAHCLVVVLRVLDEGADDRRQPIPQLGARVQGEQTLGRLDVGRLSRQGTLVRRAGLLFVGERRLGDRRRPSKRLGCQSWLAQANTLHLAEALEPRERVLRLGGELDATLEHEDQRGEVRRALRQRFDRRKKGVVVATCFEELAIVSERARLVAHLGRHVAHLGDHLRAPVALSCGQSLRQLGVELGPAPGRLVGVEQRDVRRAIGRILGECLPPGRNGRERIVQVAALDRADRVVELSPSLGRLGLREGRSVENDALLGSTLLGEKAVDSAQKIAR